MKHKIFRPINVTETHGITIPHDHLNATIPTIAHLSDQTPPPDTSTEASDSTLTKRNKNTTGNNATILIATPRLAPPPFPEIAPCHPIVLPPLTVRTIPPLLHKHLENRFLSVLTAQTPNVRPATRLTHTRRHNVTRSKIFLNRKTKKLSSSI